MHTARWVVEVGAVVTFAYGVSGCQEGDVAGQAGVPTEYRVLSPNDPPLVNEAWRIIKLATAQDVFTIELEVSDLATASDVARELVDPLKTRYAEILVYVYADGEGTGGHLPAKRIQWNAADGFVETAY